LLLVAVVVVTIPVAVAEPVVYFIKQLLILF
jgi:hypothetical protein